MEEYREAVQEVESFEYKGFKFAKFKGMESKKFSWQKLNLAMLESESVFAGIYSDITQPVYEKIKWEKKKKEIKQLTQGKITYFYNK